MLPGDGPDDPRHELRRAAGGGRREARERVDEVEHVVVGEAAEEVEQAQDRRVRDAAEQLQRPLQLARLQLRDEPDRPVEQPDEDEERRRASRAAPRAPRPRGAPPTAAAASCSFASRTATIGSPSRTLRSAMTRPNHCQWSPTARYAAPAGPRRPTRRGSETRSTIPHDSASARARLAARWDRPSASRTSRSVERLLARHEVGLDAGDRRRHAPGRAHLAPRLGELEADRLGGRGGCPFEDGVRSGARRHRRRKVAP